MSLLLITACKTGDVGGGGHLKKYNAKFLLQQLESHRLDYDWFTVKSKVQLEAPDQNIGFSADIHLRKDSIVWVSVKKLGFEAIRARITPERVELINYLDKSYESRPYAFLRREFGLPLAFGELQDLIVGNPLKMNESETKVDTAEGRYALSNIREGLILSQQLNKTSFLLEKLSGSSEKDQLTATMGDFRELNGKQIAHQKLLIVNENELKLDIQFTKVDINVPGKTTFNVPEHYEKKGE